MNYWKTGITHLNKFDPIFKLYSSSNAQFQTTNEPFKTLFKTICSQQLSTVAANSIFSKSESIFKKITLYHLNSNIKLIEKLPLTKNKKKSIISLVNFFHENKKIKWNKKSDDEVYNLLIQIFGIGPWTIQMFLIFYKGSKNIVPLTDLGLINAYKLFYNDPKLLKINDHLSIWKPYGTIVTVNLWNAYDSKVYN